MLPRVVSRSAALPGRKRAVRVGDTFLKEGYNARVTQDVQTILGRSPAGIRKYARDYKQTWL